MTIHEENTHYDLYKFIDHWPHPPQHIIDAIDLDRVSRLKATDGKVDGESFMDYGTFIQRKLTNWNGASYLAATNYRTKNDAVAEWVRHAIANDFVDAGVTYTVVNEIPNGHVSVSTGAHTDVVKDFTAIYLLWHGGGDDLPSTVFWQEQDHEIYRPPQTQGQDGSRLKEIDRVQIPLHRWVILDARVLHSCENLFDTRLGLQISFLENPIPNTWPTKHTNFRHGQVYTNKRFHLT
jgi:hypothetical protein